jgi:hypothetical protein
MKTGVKAMREQPHRTGRGVRWFAERLGRDIADTNVDSHKVPAHHKGRNNG